MVVIRFVSILLCLSVFMFFPSSGRAHPGAVDSSGGHYNRKTGEYHSHGQPSATDKQATHRGEPDINKPTPAQYREKAATTKPKKTPEDARADTAIKTSSINNYFRAANENVGALDCNVVIHSRDVDEAKKRIVRNRDGGNCVVCGSKNKLEVDHVRGLQNGGTNDTSNLALLCDICHTSKTKSDNSLRRVRESRCRKK
jgi:5-methylcytosine-specific restriction protein A